jgi:hypothetical protein
MPECTYDQEHQESSEHGTYSPTAEGSHSYDIGEPPVSQVVNRPDELPAVGLSAITRLHLQLIANELFSFVKMEDRFDPDEPDHAAIVVSVFVPKDATDVSSRRREWHRRTHAAVNALGPIQLLISRR